MSESALALEVLVQGSSSVTVVLRRDGALNMDLTEFGRVCVGITCCERLSVVWNGNLVKMQRSELRISNTTATADVLSGMDHKDWAGVTNMLDVGCQVDLP